MCYKCTKIGDILFPRDFSKTVFNPFGRILINHGTGTVQLLWNPGEFEDLSRHMKKAEHDPYLRFLGQLHYDQKLKEYLDALDKLQMEQRKEFFLQKEKRSMKMAHQRRGSPEPEFLTKLENASSSGSSVSTNKTTPENSRDASPTRESGKKTPAKPAAIEVAVKQATIESSIIEVPLQASPAKESPVLEVPPQAFPAKESSVLEGPLQAHSKTPTFNLPIEGNKQLKASPLSDSVKRLERSQKEEAVFWPSDFFCLWRLKKKRTRGNRKRASRNKRPRNA